MRVMYVINEFAWAGAEKLVFELAIQLKKKVQSVSIVALYERNDRTEKDIINTLTENGIDTLIVGKRAGKERFICVKKILSFAKEKRITIIHGHCSVPMLFSKIVGFILHVPVICTIHSTNGYSKYKEILTSWMVKKYVSIGEAAESYMVDSLHINRKKIVRIYNAVNVNAFSNREKQNDFWKPYGGKSTDLVLINVARISEVKNQICLLKAVEQCIKYKNNIKLYILGDTNSSRTLYENLLNYIQSHNLENNVFFLGEKRNVNEYLANSDIFVMSSFYEGLSLAFLEAVIMGLPIITTKLAFVDELNKISECATIVPQNNDVEFSKQILNNSVKRQEEETVKKFKKIFSLENNVMSHYNLYNICLKED